MTPAAAMTCRWTFAPGVPEALTRLLAAGVPPAGAVMVKENRKRTVWRVPLATVPGVSGLYLKHDHPRSLRDRIKGVWRCKTEEEYRAGLALAAAGVPCVPMLGWTACGRGESWLATGELPGCREFDDVWKESRQDPARRRRFEAGLAAFQRRLVTAGVRHPDLHAGNVLVAEGAEETRFFLVDVYGVRACPDRSAGAGGGVPLFLWLVELFQGMTQAAVRDFFLASGLCRTRADFGPVWNRFWDALRKDDAGRWSGRRHRFMHDSCWVTVRSAAGGGRWWTAKPFGGDAAVRLAGVHDRHMRDGGAGVLKNGRKRCVTRVQDPAGSGVFVVKEFRKPGPLWPWAGDVRAWLNSQRLGRRQLQVPACFAWHRGGDGRGLLIYEDAGRLNLADALEQEPRDRLPRLAAAAGRLLGEWHRAGIYHADMKPSNFLVRDPRPSGTASRPLAVIDLEDVSFGRAVSAARRRRNLRQMRDGLGGVADGRLRDRLWRHFLAAYRSRCGLSREAFIRLLNAG